MLKRDARRSQMPSMRRSDSQGAALLRIVTISAVQKKPPSVSSQRQNGAETVNRTRDTALFRRVLYQLSYLGAAPMLRRRF